MRKPCTNRCNECFCEGRKSSLLYLKFRFLGNNYQTKFMALQGDDLERLQTRQMKAVDMLVLNIKKTMFLMVDFSN